MSKDIEDVNNYHPTVPKYKYRRLHNGFNPHRTFSRVNYMLNYKISRNLQGLKSYKIHSSTMRQLT